MVKTHGPNNSLVPTYFESLFLKLFLIILAPMHSMKLKFLMFLAFLPLLLLELGCASYHFGHYKRTFPGGYDRVAIPVFQNKTSITGIESYFTQALRMEFERSGMSLVTSKADAQVILEGSVDTASFNGSAPTSYSADPTGIQTPNAPPYPTAGYPTGPAYPNPLPLGATLNKTYTSNSMVTIVARKVSDNKVLWTSTFTSSRNYSAPLLGSPSLTGANALYNEISRTDTIQKQAKDMMTEAHDRLTENF